ncbi:MAG: adenylate/guanylate cyclase domain-containing protein [Bacteroidia bacterium]
MNKNFSILYVDDEPQNLISFRATFRREYAIFTASSGEEGLEVLRQNKIHLIITDERMPGNDRRSVSGKTIPEYPECIRIVLTGFTDMEAIISVINNGRIFRYITKPWDENELRMTIENARQLHELQDKNKRLFHELKAKVEEQERTLKLFMKYVPETIVEKALSNTTDSIFEGELREIAVLFCDIRGFTNMSEELSPKEVVAFLNDYYAIMSAVIKRYEGTVNQFVGDEIFAAFGTPVIIPNYEQRAVLCALDMMEKLKELNARYKEKMGREIEMGIGINSGEVVAGNLGSEDKISYSVTGDTVNTGKRIETLTKEAPNTILISDRIYHKVENMITAFPWEPIEVKGKREKIQVYQVTGRS